MKRRLCGLLFALAFACAAQFPHTFPATTPAAPPAPVVAPALVPQTASAFQVSDAVLKQSDPAMLAAIAGVALEFGLEVAVLRPGHRNNLPHPGLQEAWYISGLAGVKQWFGQRVVMASEFFPSIYNDVPARMQLLARDVKPPQWTREIEGERDLETRDAPRDLPSSLNLSVGGALPGEQAYVATLDYARTVRETMDPEIRRGFDALNLEIARAFWKLFGVAAAPPATAAAH